MGKILIVDDSDELRHFLATLVKKEGHAALDAASCAEALSVLGEQVVDVVFLDIGLPDGDGIQLIPRIRELAPDTDIVMVTAVNDIQTAVTALKAGAIDYILKPFEMIEFTLILGRIMQGRLSSRQVQVGLRERGIDFMLGESAPMLRLRERIATAAGVRSPVLLTGETGTGKELVARAIHRQQMGDKGVFVKVDCSTLSPTIIESELFGYEKGAFTDARTDKKGLVEMADGGTLFLDEIGTLPVELQTKLLRLVEESVFRRVGGLRDRHVEVRIIAATNLDLEHEITKGTFRQDLFYRLNVLSLQVPPLRERGRDVIIIGTAFLQRFSHELSKDIRGLSPEAEQALLGHVWPGNIRELRNCIERAVIYSRGGWIGPADLGLQPAAPPDDRHPGEAGLVTLEAMERTYIERVLASVGDNKTLAAKILGISRTTLREKLRTD